jgi:hypothetical protein
VKKGRNGAVKRHAIKNLSEVIQCAYCGKLGTQDKDPQGNFWHLDHVVPLSQGGKDELNNLVKACQFCNLSKGAKFKTPVLGTQLASGSLYCHEIPTKQKELVSKTTSASEYLLEKLEGEIARLQKEIARLAGRLEESRIIREELLNVIGRAL